MLNKIYDQMEMEMCTIYSLNCALLDFHTGTVHSNIQDDDILFRKLHQVNFCVRRKAIKLITNLRWSTKCILFHNLYLASCLWTKQFLGRILHMYIAVIYQSHVILRYQEFSE